MSKKKKVEEQLEAILELLELVEIHLKLVHKDLELKLMKETMGLIELSKAETEAHIKELEVDAGIRKREERRSFRMLYWSIIMSSAIGVLGNLYVSLMFQPTTIWNLMGLLLSGSGIWIVFALLWLRYSKYRSG